MTSMEILSLLEIMSLMEIMSFMEKMFLTLFPLTSLMVALLLFANSLNLLSFYVDTTIICKKLGEVLQQKSCNHNTIVPVEQFPQFYPLSA
jgi:hypothetical protein